MTKITEKAIETASHPISIVALIGALSTGGAGAYMWKPVKALIETITIRHDISIYLLCDENQACVNQAWDYISQKRTHEKLRNGE